MSMPLTAVAAYAVTLAVALASAIVHPWYEAESRFLSALTGMNAAAHRVTNWTLRKDVSPDQVHPTYRAMLGL